MPRDEKGFVLLESLFAVLIASLGITAALAIHSISLENRVRSATLSAAGSEIESLMERDRGRLKTVAESVSQNPVRELFSRTRLSGLSCGDLSGLDCEETGGKTGKVCRAPENENGVVKIKYIACIGNKSFRGEQFIYVRGK